MNREGFINRPVTTTLNACAGALDTCAGALDSTSSKLNKGIQRVGHEPAMVYADILTQDDVIPNEKKAYMNNMRGGIGRVWDARGKMIGSLQTAYGLGMITLGSFVEDENPRIKLNDESQVGRAFQQLPVLLKYSDELAGLKVSQIAGGDDSVKEYADQIELKYAPARMDLADPSEVLTSGNPISRVLFHEATASTISNYASGWGLFLGMLGSGQFRNFVDTHSHTELAMIGIGSLALGSAIRIATETYRLHERLYCGSGFATILFHSGSDIADKSWRRAFKASVGATTLDVGGAHIFPWHAWAMVMAPPYSMAAFPISVGLGDQVTNGVYNLCLDGIEKIGKFLKNSTIKVSKWIGGLPERVPSFKDKNFAKTWEFAFDEAKKLI